MKVNYKEGDKFVFTIERVEEKFTGGGIAGYTLQPLGYFVPLAQQDKLVSADKED